MKITPELTVEFDEGECEDGPITVWVNKSEVVIRKGQRESMSIAHEDFKRISEQIALFLKMEFVVAQSDSETRTWDCERQIWIPEPPKAPQ